MCQSDNNLIVSWPPQVHRQVRVGYGGAWYGRATTGVALKVTPSLDMEADVDWLVVNKQRASVSGN